MATARDQMTQRIVIRYLAATDPSPIGTLALAYLKGLLRIAPVRLGSMTGGLVGQWEAFGQLLVTPMDGELVNVVCCDPGRWTWVQNVPMPKRLRSGETVMSAEVASGQQELYTDGLRNVLLTNERAPSRLTNDQLITALRYEQVVVPDAVACLSWTVACAGATGQAGKAAVPALVTVPVTNLITLHTAVVR